MTQIEDEIESWVTIGIHDGSKKVNKGVGGMPRLLEAKKDVVSCEKPRGLAYVN